MKKQKPKQKTQTDIALEIAEKIETLSVLLDRAYTDRLVLANSLRSLKIFYREVKVLKDYLGEHGLSGWVFKK